MYNNQKEKKQEIVVKKQESVHGFDLVNTFGRSLTFSPSLSSFGNSSSSSSSSLSIINTSNLPNKKLPDGLRHGFQYILASLLPDSDLMRLSRVNRQCRTWIVSESEKRVLLAVVQGQQNKAEDMLKPYPEFLLSNKARAEDYSSRTISGMTPFQAALCAWDVEMCLMMKPYFDKLENGQLELEKQFKDIFPKGLEVFIKEQEENAFNFSVICKAIQDASEDDVEKALDKKFAADTALNRALKAFRKDFDTKSKSEKVFNPYHLLKAFQCYDNAWDNWNALDQNWKKRTLLWCQVVGYTQRYLPACWAQAFAQSIYDIVENGAKLKRSFNFSWGGGSIFPLVADSGLGFDWASGVRGVLGLALDADWSGARAAAVAFTKLMSSKNIRLGKITTPEQASYSEKVAACCVIS